MAEGMEKPKWGLLYFLLKITGPLTLRLYYRKIEIRNKSFIPKDGYFIAVANHQNSFMDPALGALAIPKQLTFFGRSDVFIKPWAIFLLHQLRLYPIFRQRDHVDTITKNDPVFRFAANALNIGNPILLFPEANNDKKYRLRQLHKGFARMAFRAAELSGWAKDIHILPLGLQFDSHEKFQSRVLVTFGEPVDLSDFKTMYHEHPNRALTAIRNIVAEKLKPLMLHIDDLDNYDCIAKAVEIFAVHQRDVSLGERMKKGQNIIRKMEMLKASDPGLFVKACHLIRQYSEIIDNLRFRNHTVVKAPFSLPKLALHFLFLLIVAPVALTAIIIHYPLFWLIDKTVNKKVKDDQFLAGVKFLSGLLLYPVFYICIFLLSNIFLVWWIALLIAAVQPLLGLFGYIWWKSAKKWKSRFRFTKLSRKHDPSLAALISNREALLQMLED